MNKVQQYNRRLKIHHGLLLLAFLLPSFCQGQWNYSKKLVKMLDVLSEYHHTGIGFNETHSKFIANQIIEDIDPIGYYLYQSEIDSILDYEKVLLEENTIESQEFFYLVTRIYRRGIFRADGILNELSSSQMDLFKNEQYNSPEGQGYCADLDCLQKRWTNRIKVRNAILLSDQVVADSSWKLQVNPEEGIKDAVDFYQCKYLDRLLDEEVLNRWVESTLLNAYCKAYDPHTNYFNPVAQTKFTNSLSSDILSYGIDFTTDSEGNLSVDYVVPGGPAWKSNQIHEHDQILSIKIDGSNEVITPCMSPYQLSSVIEFSDETSITLRLKKVGGTITEVSLINELIENDENIIQSYILQGEKSIGYIGLPGFYSGNDDDVNLGSANDLGREILKLKKDGIQGLILDLRFNGGGSVMEALEISGTFIGEGSLCIQKTGEEKPKLLKDPHRGRVYTGPLIVLINEVSASASEITAGILQDHNRALIVGASSYGKGTGQIILPIDFTFDINRGTFDLGDTTQGYVNVTCCKFYNLKGGTHQMRGVQPDVHLPALYESFIDFERDLTRPIPSDSIVKKTYYTPYPVLAKSELSQLSQERLQNDERVAEIEKLKIEISESYDKLKTSNLNFSELMKILKDGDQLYMDYLNTIQVEHDNFTVSTPSFEASHISLSEQKQLIHENTIEGILEDYQLQETFLIMNDLIDKTNK